MKFYFAQMKKEKNFSNYGLFGPLSKGQNWTEYEIHVNLGRRKKKNNIIY